MNAFQDYLDLQGPLISPLCPRSPSSELINPLNAASSVFDHSSDDQCESRSENTSENRDSKTSDNLMPLMEEEDSEGLNDETKHNSYENLCVARQAAVPLLEGEGNGDTNVPSESQVTRNTKADFPTSSNTSLPKSPNSRSVSIDEDHSRSSNISLPGSEQSAQNISQSDFINSSNISLPGSGNSVKDSRQDFNVSNDSLNDASKSLLNDQDDSENFSTSFAGEASDNKPRKNSLHTEV